MKHFVESSQIVRSLAKMTCDLCKAEFLPGTYDEHGAASIDIKDFVEDENGVYGRQVGLDLCRRCMHTRLVPMLQSLFGKDLPWEKVD